MKTLTPMHSRFIVILLSLVCLTTGSSQAANKFGQASDILNVGAGARSMAMGSAFTALSDDASAAYFNPAGLAFLDEHQLMAMHAPLYEHSNYNYFSSANPFGDKWGSFSISDSLLQSSGYDLRDEGNQLLSSDGSMRNNVIIVSYAHKLSQTISGGTNLKYFQQKVAGFSGGAMGFDLGVLAKPYSFLSLGASLANINSPEVKLDSEADVYRPVTKLGVASNVFKNRLILSADYIRISQEGNQFAAGLEFKAHKLIDIRTGYNPNRSFTAGIGLNFKEFHIDYAFSDTDLGAFNKVSFMWAWHNIYKSDIVPPMQDGRAVYPMAGFENQVVFVPNVPDQMIARWSLTITDENGKVIRNMNADLRPKDKIIWDAKNDVGEPVVAGMYKYTFTVDYKNGKSWSTTGNVNMTLPHRQNDQTIDMKLDVNGAKADEMAPTTTPAAVEEEKTPVEEEPTAPATEEQKAPAETQPTAPAAQ